MSKTSPNYNCLFRIPNDEIHQNIIKEVRKMMKDYGTMWRLVTRGRKPKPGTGPYPYGSVPLKNAQELGIYLYEKESVRKEKWKRRWDWQDERDKLVKEETREKIVLLNNAISQAQYRQRLAEERLTELVGLVNKVEVDKQSLSRFINKETGGYL